MIPIMALLSAAFLNVFYSWRAKALLDAKGVPYTEIDVTADPAKEAQMIALTGRHTVPQVFVYGEHVGGSDDLAALEQSGQLDDLLAQGASSIYSGPSPQRLAA